MDLPFGLRELPESVTSLGFGSLPGHKKSKLSVYHSNGPNPRKFKVQELRNFFKATPNQLSTNGSPGSMQFDHVGLLPLPMAKGLLYPVAGVQKKLLGVNFHWVALGHQFEDLGPPTTFERILYRNS